MGVNKVKKWGRFPEEELVRALKKGDESAYEYLYNVYAPKIGSIAKAYLGHDDVDDVVQEVMMRIYKGIRKFRGDSKLSTWIHRIAINVCKDILAKRKRKKEVLTSFPENDEEGDYYAQPSSNVDVLEEVLKDLDYKSIVRAIDNLPEEDRLLIKLRDVDNLSYEEISKIMGKPVGTVKSRLHYARKKLRRILEER